MVGGREGFEKLGIVDFGDINTEVDAVKQGAGEFFVVFLNFQRRAGTFMGGIAGVTAGTGIHSGNQHEIGGVGGFLVGARDGNVLIF